MFELNAARVVYLHRDAIDFRKNINGLASLVEHGLGLNAFAQAVFVFGNRKKDRIKILGWDRNGFWLLLALILGYYIVCESATGATLGKRMVGIRVVGEDGEQVTFGAAVVRNLLRLVDAFFFYLVGFFFAILSTRGQRLGDRAAHTIVVRR